MFVSLHQCQKNTLRTKLFYSAIFRLDELTYTILISMYTHINAISSGLPNFQKDVPRFQKSIVHNPLS